MSVLRVSRRPITGIAGCCARAASGHAAVAPQRRLMNSRRRISAPKLRGQHCTGSNEYFDKTETGIETVCRSAQPMSLMGQKRRPSLRAHVSFRQQRTCRYHQETVEHAKSGWQAAKGRTVGK